MAMTMATRAATSTAAAVTAGCERCRRCVRPLTGYILVVAPERDASASAGRQLAADGYRVVEASTAAEEAAALRRCGRPCLVVGADALDESRLCARVAVGCAAERADDGEDGEAAADLRRCA
jgi:hypothetical protein